MYYPHCSKVWNILQSLDELFCPFTQPFFHHSPFHSFVWENLPKNPIRTFLTCENTQKQPQCLLTVIENFWFGGLTHAARLERKDRCSCVKGLASAWLLRGQRFVQYWKRRCSPLEINFAAQTGGWSDSWVCKGNLPTLRRKCGETASKIRSRQRVSAHLLCYIQR